MKVIFLYVDGVLNTENTFERIHNEWKNTGIRNVELDEFRIEILSKIVERTSAKIVLSSTWRLGFKKENDKLIPSKKETIELVRLLNKYNLNIYDITSNINWREDAINEWISRHSDIESFVVIDDDIKDLMTFKDKELIQTKFFGDVDESGLCEFHIDDAIRILNKDKKLIKRK